MQTFPTVLSMSTVVISPDILSKLVQICSSSPHVFFFTKWFSQNSLLKDLIAYYAILLGNGYESQ